jgi:hypothetical protein
MFHRVILIIINCSVGKIELSEYAIAIIPFFLMIKGPIKIYVLALHIKFKYLVKMKVIHQLFNTETPIGIPPSTHHLHAALKLATLQNQSSLRTDETILTPKFLIIIHFNL